jgi:type IV pilus assembly protein PilB
MKLPMKIRDPLISRVKVMARMDIAEKRLPQYGRIKIRMKVDDRSRDVDFRVSVLPTLWGEKIVMRPQDKSTLILDMSTLGFEQHSLDRFENAVAQRSGMVLLTGPPRSGKTITLYSAIASLNKPDTNIMTVETPVEFNLPGINQVQLHPSLGQSFAAVLAHVFSQDPNVIALDEICNSLNEPQNREAAAVTVQAAARGGCLVLAVMSDEDAPSAVETLAKASGQPFLLSRALRLVVAQRLVRRLCSKCKAEVVAEGLSKALIDIGFKPEEIGTFQGLKGQGCATCNGTGYKGRVGLYEVMVITEGIRDLIRVGATPVEIKRKALEEGMLTLRMSGLVKIMSGVTTVEEVLRETVL